MANKNMTPTMAKKNNLTLTGTGVALITPFTKNGTIDFNKLTKLIENIITNGVDYIVALGTTSEAATMSIDEKIALQDYIVEIINGRVPIVIRHVDNKTKD